MCSSSAGVASSDKRVDELRDFVARSAAPFDHRRLVVLAEPQQSTDDRHLLVAGGGADLRREVREATDGHELSVGGLAVAQVAEQLGRDEESSGLGLEHQTEPLRGVEVDVFDGPAIVGEHRNVIGGLGQEQVIADGCAVIERDVHIRALAEPAGHVDRLAELFEIDHDGRGRVLASCRRHLAALPPTGSVVGDQLHTCR